MVGFATERKDLPDNKEHGEIEAIYRLIWRINRVIALWKYPIIRTDSRKLVISFWWYDVDYESVGTGEHKEDFFFVWNVIDCVRFKDTQEIDWELHASK